jgi:type VI secretion system protein ImpK
MNTPNGPGHPPGYPPVPDDATIVRPRGTQPSAPAPEPYAPPPAAPAYAPAPAAPAPRADISEFLGGGMNPLVQAAAPLLLLGVQLRHSASPPDATHLREQVITQVRRFESHANAAGLPVQTVTAARYVLCAMLDESVLNAPWGEQSGWAQKTLLVTFHGESYGGAKFFQILERLCADFSRHIDLIELMYISLALGFGGRYLIEAGGRAKLADIQEDLYRRIRAQRAAAAQEAGKFADEIVPITVTKALFDKEGNETGKEQVTLDHDEGIRAGTTYEALAGLKPVFKNGQVIAEGKHVTAGNASQ